MGQGKCVNYFIVDGEKYYTGTVFKTKHYGEIVDAVFVCTYFTKNEEIVYKIDTKTYFIPIQMFPKYFVHISNAINDETQMPQTKYMRDRNIAGVSIGWLWYVVLMLFGVIIKGNIIWWIFISIVFFGWRSKKIQKEGTYIEW